LVEKKEVVACVFSKVCVDDNPDQCVRTAALSCLCLVKVDLELFLIGCKMSAQAQGGAGGVGAGAGAGAAGDAAGAGVGGAAPFKPVTRRIFAPLQLADWKKSDGCQTLRGFIKALNDSVKGKLVSAPCVESEGTAAVLGMLERLDTLVTETPPDGAPQRFGNPAFRSWSTKMREESEGMLAGMLPVESEGAAVELAGYLHDAFGNATRLDYGSGHELAFVALLCCLSMLKVFAEPDLPALVLRVFTRCVSHHALSYDPAGIQSNSPYIHSLLLPPPPPLPAPAAQLVDCQPTSMALAMRQPQNNTLM
jgi:hypothetical protein